MLIQCSLNFNNICDLFQNRVGLDDPLVDAEGYPRQDIDVYQVRHARHRIICKYGNVMKPQVFPQKSLK